MALRIVHVSDIHFHGSGYGWDANIDQREELIRDLAGQVSSGGPIDAILVGGDIAFSGHENEYSDAMAWIEKLASTANVGSERIWTVPGNHDVSRDVLKNCMPASKFRADLRDLEHAEAVDEYLRVRLTVDAGAEAYFEPLRAYNNFARKFMCHSEPGSPHWLDQTLTLNDRPVHLTGLNTSMNSDGVHDSNYRDSDDNRHLVLGTMQCQLARADDPVHIVMAHHPPSWIRDWGVVQHNLRRAHLWLFGHEHAYSSVQEIGGGTVQLSGGAVGPERDSGGERDPYVPAYLIVTLDEDVDGGLIIESRPRYWSMRSTQFIDHPSGPEKFTVAKIPNVEGQEFAAGNSVTPEENVRSSISAIPAASSSPIADGNLAVTTSTVNLRRLAQKFGALPPTKRISIGIQLNLLDDQDLEGGQHKDLDRIILHRVGEQNLVAQLQEKVLG